MAVSYKARAGDVLRHGGEHPWDDRAAARAALDAWMAGREMVDLGLPTFGGRNPGF